MQQQETEPKDNGPFLYIDTRDNHYKIRTVDGVIHDVGKIPSIREVIMIAGGYDALFQTADTIEEIGRVQARLLSHPDLERIFKESADKIRAAANHLLV